jgi:hypothetical protein
MEIEATQNVDSTLVDHMCDQPNTPLTFVDALLEIHNTFADMIPSSFHNDEYFKSTL